MPTLFCAVFGWLMFRARVSGPFFAIMTLAMLSAWYTLILDMQPYTNGVNGITPPAPLKLGDFAIDPYSSGAYWLVLALLVAATVAAKLMTRSRFGLVVQAIRNDAERVRFLGYNVAGYETAIYTVSGFFAAVAGCCWVMMTQYVSPAQFDTTFSLSMVIWAGIGGRLSLMGSILGAFLIQSAQSYLGDTFLNTWLLVLGAFFILVVRFLPKGLIGLLESCTGAHFDRFEDGRQRCLGPSSLSAAGRVGARSWAFSRSITSARASIPSAVINDFSMELVERRCVAWSGPNGAGKTTTMDLITGRQKPTSGRIVFCEDDITGLDEHEIARRGIGRKFQVPAVFRDLTVHQNLEVAYSRSTHPLKNMFRFREPLFAAKLDEVLTLTGLSGRLNIEAGILSHGETQWLEIGMVLMQISAASSPGRARRRDDRGRDRQDSCDSQRPQAHQYAPGRGARHGVRA